MIHWPVVIQFAGDDELSFIADQVRWETDRNLSHFSYEPEDRMIDSIGVVYTLSDQVNGAVIPKLTQQRIELEEITELVRAHISQQGHCCVAKMGFGSISDAVRSVADYE